MNASDVNDRFEADLRALLERYHAKVFEHTDYNSNEECSGSHLVIENDEGLYFSLSELAE